MNFFEELPKIELHAHLNGSLSNRTLQELRKLKYGTNENGSPEDSGFYRIDHGHSMDLRSCFQKFKYAHDLTDQPDLLAYATQAVIEDFANDQVIYLELRTSPKANQGMSKHDYLLTVLQTIRKVKDTIPSITVKLLPSIDRSKGIAEANETIDLVLSLHQTFSDIIVGVDLSGPPYGTKFSDFVPVLKRAKEKDLKMALHCGEFEDDGEVREMFEFGTDRIGHGTFIEGDTLKFAKEHRIPFECCLTSNVKCATVGSYREHHFKKLWDAGHEVCICTDDFGVFDTTLSRELAICSETFELSQEEIFGLQVRAIEYAFASENERSRLMNVLNRFKNDRMPC
ncbi:adenosine deaminase-like protein [Uranotaenia lowii]|uniref:adenosine deaminase-like protein n=1 Tax=Uranotaenia lowii TaxID=190385 RepID=UPI002478436B|nr:adenosine deaminase-like protein [Uranotaenia lowii]